MNNEKEFLVLLFKNLNSNKIGYCVLRNYRSLPDSLKGSDLDILIVKKDVSKFYKTLNEVLLKCNAVIIIKYGELTPRLCIIGNSINGGFGLQLDVHEGILPYKTTKMFPVGIFFKRSQLFNKINVANDYDAALLSFLKEIFNNKKCRKQLFLEAKEAWCLNEILYKRELLKLYNYKFVQKLHIVLQENYSNGNIKELSKIGTKQLERSIKIRLAIIKSSIKKMKRFFNPPGFSIVLMGTDGSGKTTIYKKIRKPLSDSVHKALYYEHMRPNLIPSLAQFFGKKTQKSPTINPHASKPSGFLGSFIRLCYYSFDYIVGHWFKVYPVTVKKSCIWVFDRYYYDYFIDPKRGRINLPNWIIKGMQFFIPTPDLIFCLGGNPRVIYNRKPELPLEEVNLQVVKLKNFCAINKRAIWINTDVPVDNSVNNIIEAIMLNRRNIITQ